MQRSRLPPREVPRFSCLRAWHRGCVSPRAMMNVLIADDESSVVELVRVTLEDERVHVIVAADGVTALALASEVDPHLVLLDVNMPGRDGLEVGSTMRADPRCAFTPSA